VTNYFIHIYIYIFYLEYANLQTICEPQTNDWCMFGTPPGEYIAHLVTRDQVTLLPGRWCHYL